MSSKGMSLKAKIKNMARSKKLSAQVVLQNFMFEKFLERLAESEYNGKFVLKGGMLIGSMVGIENRATMDMDTTLKSFPLNKEALESAIQSICSIQVNDDVEFRFKGIKEIRDDDHYGGYRVSIESEYDAIVTPMHIDITTGDAITPKEIQYTYKKVFGDGELLILAYNTETVLAEKYETVLRRGEANTRPRDFYDLYVITKTVDFDKDLFREALQNTAAHRETDYILKDEAARVQTIRESGILKDEWRRYQRSYNYAEMVSYEEIIEALNRLM